MKRALFLVDIQNDFMPGGALAVPFGDRIIPIINEIIPKFDLVIASRDWHPKNHLSFTIENGKNVLDTIEVNEKEMVIWPPHCIQNTEGAKFHPDLKLPYNIEIFTKGDKVHEHPFSGFAGKSKGTSAKDYLKNMKIDEVYVVGLAGDYCVKDTAIDASLDFKTYFIVDATRFIGDMTTTIENLIKENIIIINSKDLDIIMSDEPYYKEKEKIVDNWKYFSLDTSFGSE